MGLVGLLLGAPGLICVAVAVWAGRRAPDLGWMGAGQEKRWLGWLAGWPASGCGIVAINELPVPAQAAPGFVPREATATVAPNFSPQVEYLLRRLDGESS